MKSLKFITLGLSMAIVLGYSAPSNAAKIILYSWSEVSAFCGDGKYKCKSIVETRDNGEEFWVIYDEVNPNCESSAINVRSLTSTTNSQCPPPGRGD